VYPELRLKLKKFNFVAIRGIGSQVVRAIQLAEDISKEFPKLKRINIPSTTLV
jgi:hypothetical protein